MVENGCEYLYWRKQALRFDFSAAEKCPKKALANLMPMAIFDQYQALES